MYRKQSGIEVIDVKDDYVYGFKGRKPVAIHRSEISDYIVRSDEGRLFVRR